MKSFISSAMILLALYAQAASADLGSFYILKTHSLTNNTEVHATSPTWTLAGSIGSPQLIGFTSINTLTSHQDSSFTTSHTNRLGFGLHQQHTPWMYSQITIKQHPFSATRMQSALALNIGF